MEREEFKEFDKADQKLIKEFLEAENLTLEDVEITESDTYDTDCLMVELGNNEYYIVRDIDDLERNVREFMLDEASEYPYFYTEGIKSGSIDPVSTCFKDWIDDILRYDGLGSVVSSYDGCLNELSGDAGYFQSN